MKRNNYFEYLCEIVGKACQYSELLAYLHDMEFYSVVPRDDNREGDGLDLRNQYFEKCRKGGDHRLDFPHFYGASVLEVMISVAQRIEFSLLDSRWEKGTDEWFWVLIDNLGLTWCDNEGFDSVVVEFRVTNMLNRAYGRNGEGSLFPLRSCSGRDVRNMEIWYQMGAWMEENYPI